MLSFLTSRLPRRARPLALLSVAVLAFGFVSGATAQQPRVLKISHQFPASTGADGDFRDQLARKFAADVEKRTNGSLKVEVYPASSLVKTFAQFGPCARVRSTCRCCRSPTAAARCPRRTSALCLR